MKPSNKQNTGEGKKAPKSKKAFLTIWSVCLFVLIVGFVLLRIGVGMVQNVAPFWISISMIVAFLTLIISFFVRAILKFKKLAKIIGIIFVALVIFTIGGFFLYSKYLTEQQTAACKLYMPKLEESLGLSDDIKKLLDKTQADIEVENKNGTPEQYKIVLVDFQNLKAKNNSWFDTHYSILDIFSKYISFFPTSMSTRNRLDIGFMTETVKNMQDALDQYYQAQISYSQALIDKKPLTELQMLYKDVNEKTNIENGLLNYQNDNLVKLNMEGFDMYSQCYSLQKSTTPFKTLQSGTIYW